MGLLGNDQVMVSGDLFFAAIFFVQHIDTAINYLSLQLEEGTSKYCLYLLVSKQKIYCSH